MLPAHLGKELGGGPGTSGFYVFVTLADAFYGFVEVLALPFQIGSQSLVERGGRILAMSLGVLLQLGLALWLDRFHLHACKLRGREARVKG
jgi:hypothetical protein